LPPEAPINRSKKPEWGDYSGTLALQLAKPAGRSPMEIAQAIHRHLPQADFIGSTSVTPPGFINMTLSAAWLSAQVDAILEAGPTFADLDLGVGAGGLRTQAQVEYVSANPTGPLSV